MEIPPCQGHSATCARLPTGVQNFDASLYVLAHLKDLERDADYGVVILSASPASHIHRRLHK